MKKKQTENHPADDALLAYCECTSDEEVDPTVRAHLLSDCERCLARVERFREILASLQAPQLLQTPEVLMQKAMESIREMSAKGATLTGRLRDLVESTVESLDRTLREVRMALTLDSAFGAALPGIRGLTTMQPRQLLFESAEGSVHLRIQKGTTGKLNVMGQFLPSEGNLEGTSVVTLQHGSKKTEQALSSSGEFRFDSILPGQVQLQVRWKDALLLAGPLELSEDPDA